MCVCEFVGGDGVPGVVYACVCMPVMCLVCVYVCVLMLVCTRVFVCVCVCVNQFGNVFIYFGSLHLCECTDGGAYDSCESTYSG